ncbi:methyltransferase domain-containing protein [Marinobacter panjinensis]|uniref:Methyltransferase domain-containing protein n=1 Tax=Marinobacter panjinensis TaxID=2576384 RepID=A0A4V6CU10_9GAMM|nr:methyltransferase domain-containing protein [Marinobacter panjinensis]MCR8915762.1 methyltransferase domain-containing protein [Marinobacter panjinensis]TKV67255.1 methyltransferase domain-containing protein [Marinobacter panjinensis]
MSERASHFCRCCESTDMFMFLPLGPHGPAQGFLEREKLHKEKLFDLNTHACLQCGLIQVPNRLPPDFFRHYLWVPSTGALAHVHFADLAKKIKSTLLTNSEDLFVDIGCNDGLLLKSANDVGIKTLGIDPAENIGQMAKEKNLTVISEYFNAETAKLALKQHGKAKVITSNNTFNHIDNLHDFMDGIRILLKQDGTFIVEVPQALQYFNNLMFDNIYHEHVSVFSVKSLSDLYRGFGMEIYDIESIDVQGGSMRVYARFADDEVTISPYVQEWLDEEKKAGLLDANAYKRFETSVEGIRDKLLSILDDLKAEGKSIIGYGASAKGNTLLNYYGIGTETLPVIVDKNTLKHGLYSPGMHIPVRPVEAIAEENPDYILILAWNFANEVMTQQEEYRRGGGKFIIPLPKPRVV